MFNALDPPFMQRALLAGLLLAVPLGLIGTWVMLRSLAFFSHAVGEGTSPGVGPRPSVPVHYLRGSQSSVAVENLSVALGDRRALEDVTFAVAPGAFVGVRGPNGAGKTKLLRALLGEVVTEGRVTFGELSGGLRRGVLVRALAQEDRVMLLDEPLSGVDSRSRGVMLDVIRQQCDAGRTVLMTTHDLAEASRVCDRLHILNCRLIAVGSTREIFTEDVLRRAYGADVLMLDGRVAALDDPHHHHHATEESRAWNG